MNIYTGDKIIIQHNGNEYTFVKPVKDPRHLFSVKFNYEAYTAVKNWLSTYIQDGHWSADPDVMITIGYGIIPRVTPTIIWFARDEDAVAFKLAFGDSE